MTEVDKNKLNIISKVIAVVWGIISITLFTIMFIINILPTKFMIIILGIYVPFLILSFFLLWLKSVKKSLKITFSVIGGLLILFLSFLGFYLAKTMNFMDRIKAKDYQFEEYYVMVLKSSDYEEINDINSKAIGVVPLNSKVYLEAITQLNKSITTDKVKYDDFIKLGQDLLDGQLEVIFLSLSHRSIIDDINDDFESKVRVIKTISVKVNNEVEIKEADVSNESFNIYISGSDQYGKIALRTRSDVNIIMTVNPKTNKILLVNVPRDYYVQLNGTRGLKDKLTHAGTYGVDKSIKTIENILDIDINYYMRFNFSSFISLIDAIGGIDINSDKAFISYPDEVKINKGLNRLNGVKALAFARERKTYSKDGDIQRGRNQQLVITTVLNKIMKSKTLITRYSSILDSLGKSFETNIVPNKFYELINYQLDKMPNWNFESISLLGVGNGEYKYTYSISKKTSWVMIPDENSIKLAKEKIKEVTNKK